MASAPMELGHISPNCWGNSVPPKRYKKLSSSFPVLSPFRSEQEKKCWASRWFSAKVVGWIFLVSRDEKWAKTFWPEVGCRAKFAQFLALATKAFILYPKETYWWDLMFLSKGKKLWFPKSGLRI